MCVLVMLSLACCRVDAAVLVSGQVVSGGDGVAVGGATISVTGVDTPPSVVPAQVGPPATESVIAHTLANGSFLLKVPHPGYYSFKVDAAAFEIMGQPVYVTAAGLLALRLELSHSPTVRLKVLTPGGALVTAGDVQVWLLVGNRRPGQPAAGIWATKHATPDGLLEVSTSRNISLADAGAVEIAVRVKGVGAASVYRAERPKETVTVQLAPGKTIVGKVVNAAGTPLAGLHVDLNAADRDLAHRFLQGRDQTTSGEGGTFQFTDLLPGRYDITFRMPPLNEVRYRLLTLTADRTVVTLTPQDLIGPERPPEFANTEGGSGEMTLMLPAPLSAIPALGITVSGKATANGRPRAGVVIGLFAAPTNFWHDNPPVDIAISAADGSFSFAAPAPGPYQMYTGFSQEADYQPVNLAVRVPAGGVTGIAVPVENRLNFRVRMIGVDGKLVTSGKVNVALQVQSSKSNWGFNQSSDVGPDGLVPLRSYNNVLPATETATGVSLTVRHDTAGWAHLHLDHWTEGPVTLQLRKGATILGQVVDEAGRPIKDASLRLNWLEEENQEVSFEDMGQDIGNVGVTAGANFSLTQLPLGDYRLTTAAPGYSDQSTVVHVLPTANPFLTVRMVKGQTLTIHVVDPNDQPAVEEDLQVQVYNLSVNQWHEPQLQRMTDVTPNRGVQELTGLFPGTYFATAQLSGGEWASQVVTIVPGKDVLIVLRLASQKKVTLRVVDAAGKPVAGAAVKILSIVEQGGSTTVGEVAAGTLDEGGHFDLTLQHLGVFLVKVTLPGGKIHNRLINVGTKTTAVTLNLNDAQ